MSDVVLKKSAALSFVGGTLCIKISGHGDANGCAELQMEEDDIQNLAHDERDGSFWLLRLPASELKAIQSFLNEWLP